MIVNMGFFSLRINRGGKGTGKGTFVPSVLEGKAEGDHSPKACAGLADQNQVACALQEVFHGARNLRQTLWPRRILGTFGTNPFDIISRKRYHAQIMAEFFALHVMDVRIHST